MLLTLLFWPGLASVMSGLFEGEPWGWGHWLAWGAADREGMSRCLPGPVTAPQGSASSIQAWHPTTRPRRG